MRGYLIIIYIYMCLAIPHVSSDDTGTDITPDTAVCQNFKNNKYAQQLISYKDTFFTTSGTIDGEDYTFTVAVCKDVYYESTEGIRGLKSSCSVVQTKSSKDSEGAIHKTAYCLGVNLYVEISPDPKKIPNPHDWMELWYFEGDAYKTHCSGKNRSSRIIFLCDRNAYNGELTFIEEDNDNGKLCSYIFILKTSLICSPVPYSISGFWIFVLVFLSLFAVLIIILLMGIAIKRFVFGAKGWDQVPLISVWRFIGNHLADCCNACCRCGEGHPSMPNYSHIPKPDVEKNNKFGMDDSDSDTPELDSKNTDTQILAM